MQVQNLVGEEKMSREERGKRSGRVQRGRRAALHMLPFHTAENASPGPVVPRSSCPLIAPDHAKKKRALFC